MANRNDEALRARAGEMIQRLGEFALIQQRRRHLQNAELARECAELIALLTPRSEPAEAMGGEDAAMTEWRWVDEQGRAMTNWKRGYPPPMGEVSDAKGTMRVELRMVATLSRPEPAGRVEAVAWQYRWKCDPTGSVYNTFVHPIEGNGRTEDEIEWWVYGVKPAAHAPQEGVE